jgi:hypothetical protein
MQDDAVPLAVITAMLGILDDAVARDATLHAKLDLGVSGAAGDVVIDLLFRQPQAAGAAAPASVPQVLPALRVRVCACAMLLAEICEPVAAHRVMCRDMLRVQLLHFPPTQLSLLSVTIPFVCFPTQFGADYVRLASVSVRGASSCMSPPRTCGPCMQLWVQSAHVLLPACAPRSR